MFTGRHFGGPARQKIFRPGPSEIFRGPARYPKNQARARPVQKMSRFSTKILQFPKTISIHLANGSETAVDHTEAGWIGGGSKLKISPKIVFFLENVTSFAIFWFKNSRFLNKKNLQIFPSGVTKNIPSKVRPGQGLAIYVGPLGSGRAHVWCQCRDQFKFETR